MTRIILEDTSGGVVDQHKALVSAHVSQSECPNNVGPNGLDLVGFTPVHVWSARDAGRVEDMARLHGCDVGFEWRTVLEAPRAVNEVDSLSLAYLPQQAANPAGATIDQELVRLVGGWIAVGWDLGLWGFDMCIARRKGFGGFVFLGWMEITVVQLGLWNQQKWEKECDGGERKGLRPDRKSSRENGTERVSDGGERK